MRGGGRSLAIMGCWIASFFFALAIRHPMIASNGVLAWGAEHRSAPVPCHACP